MQPKEPTKSRRLQRSLCRLSHLILVVLVLGSPVGQVAGQDESETKSNKFELSGLDTFLKNKDGSLIQYFNITFEEFERVYNALNSNSAPQASDNFTIRTANVVAKIRSSSAQIDIEMTIVPETDSRVEVPVNFDKAFFPTPNPSLVLRDGKYFVRVQGKPNEEQAVRLKAVQKVDRVRGRKQLKLNLPSATFTTIQVHEMEPGLLFSADQDSISKPVRPFFSGGSAFEFAGLKDSVSISWGPANEQPSGLMGTLAGGYEVTATIEPNQIRYDATFSIQANSPISKIQIGLPKETIEASLAESNGMTFARVGEQQAWAIYELEFGRQGTAFSDLRLQWVVKQPVEKSSLIGFEIFGFRTTAGQLTVRSASGISFVLANRFNMDKEERTTPNRVHSYELETTIFSASVFTIEKSARNEKRADMNLKLGADSAVLEVVLPDELTPENPDSVSVKLNGWKLNGAQDNLTVDTLLQQVDVSPLFFLNDNSSRSIMLSMEMTSLGEKELQFPEFVNLPVDQIRVVLSCTEDLVVRFERNRNPGFELASQFESEVVFFGKSLALSSRNTVPNVKLRLDPVLPFVEANRSLKLVESRGAFFLDSTVVIESSREFDNLAVIFHQTPESVSLNSEAIDLAGQENLQPFLIELRQPARNVTVEMRFDLGAWESETPLGVRLTDFFLPVAPGSEELIEDNVEVKGRTFAPAAIDSELAVVTSAAIKVKPDPKWELARGQKTDLETHYLGNESSDVEFEKTDLTDEDVRVLQAWCHTSLNSEFRQDRVTIRFVPKRSVVVWRIPEGTRLVSCRLNNQPLTSIIKPDETVVESRFDQLFEEHLIEFEFRFFHSSFENELHVRMPKTRRVLWCQNMYWSVQLPDSHYVLNYSDGLSSSYLLSWTGFFLRPTPKLSVSQLERWIGCNQANTLERRGNDYLFSSFGIVDDRKVLVISKTNLVLIFGLIFITLGCAFVSLSFMRNSLFLVTIAAGILILGMWYPIWFIQLLQIEIFVGFLFGVGFVVTRFANWVNPAKDETRIETNVPSLVLAAPDSGIEQSAETRGQSGSKVPQ